MSKNNKGSQPAHVYETPIATAKMNISINQPRKDNNIYETINSPIYENDSAQNTPAGISQNRRGNKWRRPVQVFLFLVLFISLAIGILFYHNLKGEMDNQKAVYHSVNNSVIEIKNKIDEILYKIDEIVKFISPKILVMGGWDGTQSSSDMFLLDYYQKTWKQLSIKLPYEVWGHGTVILDDQLYIIGGYFSNTLYRLNKQMEWEKLADMHEKRGWITNSCLVHNGNIWVIGGWNGTTSLNTIEKYDPATNRWEMKPAMKRRREDTAAAVINNKIYVCGGWDRSSILDSVEVFDIESEVWTYFNTLPAKIGYMSIVVDRTSIVLICGIRTNTVWKMDVEEKNKGWINLPPLKERRVDSSAVRIETGRILVFGGETYNNGTLSSSSSVETFDGHKWESFTPLPEPRRSHSSVVLTSAMVDVFRPYILK